jgi:hypothetical protein
VALAVYFCASSVVLEVLMGGALCVLFVHSVSPLEAIIHKL